MTSGICLVPEDSQGYSERKKTTLIMMWRRLENKALYNKWANRQSVSSPSSNDNQLAIAHDLRCGRLRCLNESHFHYLLLLLERQKRDQPHPHSDYTNTHTHLHNHTHRDLHKKTHKCTHTTQHTPQSPLHEPASSSQCLMTPQVDYSINSTLLFVYPLRK